MRVEGGREGTVLAKRGRERERERKTLLLFDTQKKQFFMGKSRLHSF